MEITKVAFLSFIMICLGINVFARDLGVYGKTWEIKEKDALEAIMAKLADMESRGEIEKQNKKFAEKIKKKLLRPTPVKGILYTTKPREYLYEPSSSYHKDLKDHKGKVFYKAHTKVNSLDYMSMPYELIFLDGDDQRQISWGVSKYKEAEIKPIMILVKGEPIALSEETDIEFYFDQYGVMTKQLRIEQVPAVVRQEGRYLKISELILKCEKQKNGEEICQEE